MSTEEIIQTEQAPEQTQEKNNKNKFHSPVEKFYVDQILKVNLSDAEKELDKRIVVQHKDFSTGIPTFNATARRVLVTDNNGKKIIINNHDEIKKQQRLNARLAENGNIIKISQISDVSDNDVIEFDD